MADDKITGDPAAIQATRDAFSEQATEVTELVEQVRAAAQQVSTGDSALWTGRPRACTTRRPSWGSWPVATAGRRTRSKGIDAHRDQLRATKATPQMRRRRRRPDAADSKRLWGRS